MTQRFSNDYGACHITALPGCPQVAVSHGVFVLPEHRRKGHGDKNHKLRLKRMKDLHYDYAVCTVATHNLAEKKNLEDNGWYKLDSFVSSNTLYGVELWGKEL